MIAGVEAVRFARMPAPHVATGMNRKNASGCSTAIDVYLKSRQAVHCRGIGISVPTPH